MAQAAAEAAAGRRYVPGVAGRAPQLGVQRGEQDPEQAGQGARLASRRPAEQRVLGFQQVGQAASTRWLAGRGERDQDAAPVLRVGLAGGPGRLPASRSTRLVIVPEVTSVARSSAPGLSS